MMARPGAPALALLLVLVLGALAGCLGGADEGTPAKTPATSPGPSASMGPTPSVSASDRPLIEVDGQGAIFAPLWSVGDAWTYAVTGAYYPRAYSATLGVVEVQGDRYVLATDSDEELRNGVHFGAPFLGGMHTDTLAIHHADAFQDLLGFQRDVGSRWDVSLLGELFTMTREAARDVDHALGTARGLVTTGVAAAGDTLVVEYASDVKTISRLVWSNATGVLMLSYALEAQADGASGLRQWDVTSFRNGDASGAPNNVGADQWQSDGSGDFVFGRIAIRPAPVTGALVLDPAGGVVANVQGEAGAPTHADVQVPDAAGSWSMLLYTSDTSSAARVDVWLYQIKETTF